MTVGELIAALQQHDPSVIVVNHGYEGGVTEVTEVEAVRLRLNVNTAWYYGPHEVADDGPPAVLVG